MAVSPTRPKPYPQGDGSWAQWLNCVLASATDLMCRASVGYWRVAASKLRTITRDTSGGVTFEQAAAATKTATNGEVILDPRYGLIRSEMKNLIDAGRACAVSISCWVTRYTSRRTNTFTGSHAVYVNDYAWRTTTCFCEKDKPGLDHGEYLIDDPGTTAAGYMWWSAELVYKAAEANGGGRISVMVCRDTEGVWRKARKNGTIRSSTSTTSKKTGSITQGQSYFVALTLEGGDWVSDTDDGLRNDWHRVKFGDGKYGYTKGENLR
jgi:hypothetical protein